MENKDKKDISVGEPEELLTAPLPPIDDLESLESYFSITQEADSSQTQPDDPSKSEPSRPKTQNLFTPKQHDDNLSSKDSKNTLDSKELDTLKNLLNNTTNNSEESDTEPENIVETTESQETPSEEDKSVELKDTEEKQSLKEEPADLSTSEKEETADQSEEEPTIDLSEIETVVEVQDNSEEPKEESASETKEVSTDALLDELVAAEEAQEEPDTLETEPLNTSESVELSAEPEEQPAESSGNLFILDENHKDFFEDEPKNFNSKEIDDFSDNTFSNGSVITAQEKKPSRSKLPWIIAGAVVVIALLGVYIWGINYYKDRFLPNTYISGYNMSNKSLDEAVEILDTATQERKVTIKGSDGAESEVLASEVGLVLTESPNVEETIETQNVYAWPLSLIASNGTHLETDHELNEDALNQVILALPIVSGDQVVLTENAHAEYDKAADEFVIKEEVYGTQVDAPRLGELVMEALVDGDSVIDLEDEGLYVLPKITSDNETLAKSVDTLNDTLSSVITYNFEVAQEVVNKDSFTSWLTTDENGEVAFVPGLVEGYVQILADKYDTYDKPVYFTTTGGSVLEYVEDIDGWEIDQVPEIELLQANILSGEVTEREPVYAYTGRSRAFGNTMGNTYLEISIGSQTMWYYKDGELITSTSVVTGNPYEGNGTTKGYFVLQNKETNVTLKGNNADGSAYATPVTFWLPFNGGIGVHDSSWRSSYGGSIYLGGGSHGCVNTPYSAVRTIYNNISVGDPVIVY